MFALFLATQLSAFCAGQAVADPSGHAFVTRTERIHRPGRKYPAREVRTTARRDRENGTENVVASREMVGDHIIVGVQEGITAKELSRLAGRLGGRIRRRTLDPYVYLVTIRTDGTNTVESATTLYAANSNVVRFAEPDNILYLDDTEPDDPYYGSGDLWGLTKVACPAAWDWSTGRGTTVVAVVDTGIDYDHEDLAVNSWVNPGESGIDVYGRDKATNRIDDDMNGFIDDVRGWDFHNDDSDPMDGHGHGTTSAGTIGAAGDNGTGVVGVCWSVKLMAIKLYSDLGEAYDSDAVDAFNYVSMMRSNGVNVRLTSNSWGTDDYSEAMRTAVEGNGRAGILCVASAGNDSRDLDQVPRYPICFDLDNVIGVGGTTAGDALTVFSSYGFTNVDLAAPAEDILSTRPGNAYFPVSHGVSRATPHVAGAAALLLELSPFESHQEIRRLLLDSVDIFAGLTNRMSSGGRLNIGVAAPMLGPIVRHVPLANSSSTNDPYTVAVDLYPLPFLVTNSLLLRWNTNGSTTSFVTNRLWHVGGDSFEGAIGPESLGTEIYYYLESSLSNGLSATHPSNAPASLHRFEVVEPLSLTITGMPTGIGTAEPSYGTQLVPSGNVISVSAGPYSDPTGGSRYAVTGWVGYGSVPSAGSNEHVTFTIARPSTCTWQWVRQSALYQTSGVPGILPVTTWWNEDSVAATRVAPWEVVRGTNTYIFLEWRVDGARWPAPVGPAENPATDILMSTVRTAEATYLLDTVDLDGDGLPDAWEWFYFGGTSAVASVDSDGDGEVNSNEFIAGTVPTDGSNFLSVAGFAMDMTTTNIVLSWYGVTNRTYSLWSRPSMVTGTWTVVTNDVSARVPVTSVGIDAIDTRKFYRISVDR